MGNKLINPLKILPTDFQEICCGPKRLQRAFSALRCRKSCREHRLGLDCLRSPERDRLQQQHLPWMFPGALSSLRGCKKVMGMRSKALLP